jgi:hypothetical protein
MISNCVCARASDLAEIQPRKTTLAFEYMVLLVVDIDQVKLTGTVGEVRGELGEQTAHYGSAEGIKEEDEARARGECKLNCVAAHESSCSAIATGLSPQGNIFSRSLRKRGIEFDSDYVVEWHLGGEQDGTSHARTHIHKSEVLDGGGWMGSSPSAKQGLEDRRRDTEVRSGVAIVAMAALEMATGNQAAGANPILNIERMPGVSIFYR